MKKIYVDLKSNSYSIFVGHSIFSLLPEILAQKKLNKNILAVVDANVEKLNRGKIKKLISAAADKHNVYLLKPGENSKSYTELNKIYSFLLDNNYGRDTLIIAVGGGVTGDLAGYAAATFMRGVQLVHIPTTLLAAVDSSIGGKTGINFEKKKNMIGSFYQPELVLIDTEFLETLPKDEMVSGAGEIVKYAYLSDSNFYSFILENISGIISGSNKQLEKAILNSAAIKAAVVSQDEKESGLRKILNLGHTFAHAFETELNFKIKHGQAVTAGVIAALNLSSILNLLPGRHLNNLLQLPKKIVLPRKLTGLNNENLFRIMLHDKKNRNGKIKFVLLSEVGNLLLDVEADKKYVFKALDKMKKDIVC